MTTPNQHPVDQAFVAPEDLDAQSARAFWETLRDDPSAQTRWNTLAQAEGLLWDQAGPPRGSAAQIGRQAFLGALDAQLAEEHTLGDQEEHSATILAFPIKRVLAMAAMLCVIGVGAVLASKMIAQPVVDGFQPRSALVDPSQHPGVQLFCATPADDASGQPLSIHSAQDEAYGVLTCPIDGKLMVRMARPAHKDGWMAVFGVSDQGDIHWIAPSPVSPDPVRVRQTEQRRIGQPIDLQVNHKVGKLRMHALFSDRPIPYDALAQWLDDARSASLLPSAQSLTLGTHHSVSAPYHILEVAP